MNKRQRKKKVCHVLRKIRTMIEASLNGYLGDAGQKEFDRCYEAVKKLEGQDTHLGRIVKVEMINGEITVRIVVRPVSEIDVDIFVDVPRLP